MKNKNFLRFVMRDVNNPQRTIASLVLAGLLILGVLILAPPREEAEEGGAPTSVVPAATVQLPVAPMIAASEAMAAMGDTLPHILLDVRTEAEFETSHIPGAVLIPHTELAEWAPVAFLNQDVRIFVYCQSGRRSAEAASVLLSLGYTNVYDLGGIADWPYETVRG